MNANIIIWKKLIGTTRVLVVKVVREDSLLIHGLNLKNIHYDKEKETMPLPSKQPKCLLHYPPMNLIRNFHTQACRCKQKYRPIQKSNPLNHSHIHHKQILYCKNQCKLMYKSSLLHLGIHQIKDDIHKSLEQQFNFIQC